MPLLPYANGLEPPNEAVVWRYMDLRKFRDLMASEELYFRRADLFTDKSEGLPTDDYATRVLGLHPYDIRDWVSLNHHLGSLAQHREAYYISYWYLYGQDTLDIWEQYGHDGVAICSRYELLKAALDGLLDEAHLGWCNMARTISGTPSTHYSSSPRNSRSTRRIARSAHC